MTEICSVCGSEIPSRDYWNIGSVKITWFGGDESFRTKACMEGSTISHRRWPRVCKACMARGRGRAGGKDMSELFRMRSPGRTPMDVLLEYIGTHPGCTRNEMRRELASISHESYLRKLVSDGRVRKYGSKPQRYEVVS